MPVSLTPPTGLVEAVSAPWRVSSPAPAAASGQNGRQRRLLLGCRSQLAPRSAPSNQDEQDREQAWNGPCLSGESGAAAAHTRRASGPRPTRALQGAAPGSGPHGRGAPAPAGSCSAESTAGRGRSARRPPPGSRLQNAPAAARAQGPTSSAAWCRRGARRDSSTPTIPTTHTVGTGRAARGASRVSSCEQRVSGS